MACASGIPRTSPRGPQPRGYRFADGLAANPAAPASGAGAPLPPSAGGRSCSQGASLVSRWPPRSRSLAFRRRRPGAGASQRRPGESRRRSNATIARKPQVPTGRPGVRAPSRWTVGHLRPGIAVPVRRVDTGLVIRTAEQTRRLKVRHELLHSSRAECLQDRLSFCGGLRQVEQPEQHFQSGDELPGFPAGNLPSVRPSRQADNQGDLSQSEPAPNAADRLSEISFPYGMHSGWPHMPMVRKFHGPCQGPRRGSV